MKKTVVFSLMLLAVFLMATAAVAQKAPTIKIGINAEITGDIPKVGEATKFAAQMYVEDVNKAGGIEVGGKKYMLELAVEDNEAKAESAAKSATKLITRSPSWLRPGVAAGGRPKPRPETLSRYGVQAM